MKNFSLKQLLTFRRAPVEVLDFVFGLRDNLPLTASLIDELCHRLNDHLRATGGEIATFVQNPQLQSIVQSDADPRSKIAQLRSYLAALRMPTLTRQNREMDILVTEAALPKNISVTWDRTLDRREVIVTLRATAPTDLNSTIELLEKQKKPLMNLFDNL